MKKKTTFSVFLISILFFLTFGNIAKAQVTTSYIGVSQGDEYIWKAEVNLNGVDTLVSNIREIMVDQQNKLDELVLFGFEDLTINETVELLAHTYLANILPTGWETYNLSTLVETTIKDYVVKFNSTIFSGLIPSNWESLNFSTFYDYMFDGINTTMVIGWGDNPFPGLIEMMVNELDSPFLFGLIPEGWEDQTLIELCLSLLEIVIPGIDESFMLNTWISEVWGDLIPPEFNGLTVMELLNKVFEPLSMNGTYLFESMFLGLNGTLPYGMESDSMSVVIDYYANLLNIILPVGYDSYTSAELIDIGTDFLVYYSIPSEFHELTLVEIISLGMDEAILAYDQYLVQWDQILLMLQGSGMSSYEIGIKMTIDNIGIIESVFPGGPEGVNLDVTLYYSFDMGNWTNLSLLMTDLDTTYMDLVFAIIATVPSLDFVSGKTMIFDPSTYSNTDIALMDQLIYTGGLIVANNYNWATIQTAITIKTINDPNCVAASISWNGNGILTSATITASGVSVASITLLGQEDTSPEIPGYEIPIILSISSIALVAIIYRLKRKNRIIR